MEGLLGRSTWAEQMRHSIERCAPHAATVLITGPTGTGKEVIARSIHQSSPRAGGLFVAVDCTTITGPLFASQLFGHRKGAFTGAAYDALGCFRVADQGTIFLDEIGELELDLQAKLLRVLQERVVAPLGGHESIPVDVRVVCATNRDLKREVSEGRFREDLFYRLNVVLLETTPLNSRTDDIPLLIEDHLQQLAERGGFPLKQLSPGAMELLTGFEWPGNVRQLRHLIEQAVITCDEALITLPLAQRLLDRARMPEQRRALPLPQGEGRSEGAPRATAPPPSSATAQFPLAHQSGRGAGGEIHWKTLEDLEREHIRTTLEHTYYNQTAAARLLGISRQALIRKIKGYELALPKQSR